MRLAVADEDFLRGRRPAVADKYRKRPVVIEAMRFGAYTEALPFGDLYWWLYDGGCSFRLEQVDPGPAFMLIYTLEGWMRADIGDWIIRGVKGEHYPCKPDVFAMTYEPAEEARRG
jgi:hypothetical protein